MKEELEAERKNKQIKKKKYEKQIKSLCVLNYQKKCIVFNLL